MYVYLSRDDQCISNSLLWWKMWKKKCCSCPRSPLITCIKYNEHWSCNDFIYFFIFFDLFIFIELFIYLPACFALDRQIAWRDGSNAHVSVWLLQVGICFVFWQSGGELWLCCCGAELTLCVWMRFFYALFHTEHS